MKVYTLRKLNLYLKIYHFIFSHLFDKDANNLNVIYSETYLDDNCKFTFPLIIKYIIDIELNKYPNLTNHYLVFSIGSSLLKITELVSVGSVNEWFKV